GLKEEHQYETIALGSHQDDQVETILLNLSRGSSISGLRGMLPRSGHWVKPMLFASKAQIAQFAQDNRIEYRQDSSNQTDYYERNRIRHHVIPQLKQINPSLEKTVMRNTAYLRAIELVWQEKVDEVRANVLESDNHQIRLQLSLLAQYQPVSAYLFELLHPFGFNSHQSDVLLEMMEAPPGKEMHSATHSLYTDRQHWIIVPKSEPVQSCHYSIGAGTESIEQPLSMCFRKCTIDHQPAGKATLATLDADRLQFPLALRTWRPGDRFRPLGMTGSKKLSDFFTDQKISRPNKQSTWLLCSGEDIVWVVGHRIDDRYKIGEATKNIYIAEWLKA
ncbi:MAG: tRNA lysidine(34) synthetase TilS, partial [Salibacteraceae bacterium]